MVKVSAGCTDKHLW